MILECAAEWSRGRGPRGVRIDTAAGAHGLVSRGPDDTGHRGVSAVVGLVLGARPVYRSRINGCRAGQTLRGGERAPERLLG